MRWQADPEGHCDFNGDGIVDDKDVAIWNAGAATFYLHFVRDLDPYYARFDVNGDGIINILDYTIMANMYIGIDDFHPGQRLQPYVEPWVRATNGLMVMTVLAGMSSMMIKEAA